MSMEKVTVQRSEILAGFQAAATLEAPKATWQFKAKLMDFKAIVRQAGIPIEDTIKQIKKDHAKLDADGNPKPLKIRDLVIPNEYEYEDPEKFEQAQREYLESTVEIEVPLFVKADFEGMDKDGFTGGIEGLRPFIKGPLY